MTLTDGILLIGAVALALDAYANIKIIRIYEKSNDKPEKVKEHKWHV